MRGATFLVAVSAMALAAPAAAQQTVDNATDEQSAKTGEQSADQQGDIVVTAVASGRNRLDSSVSVSSLSETEI